MAPPPQPVAGTVREALDRGWQLGSLPAGSAASDPERWIDVPILGPVAAVLRDAGAWSLDGAPRRFDAEDWVYRLAFDAAPAGPGERVVLGFDGLATVATATLNGEALLASDNMFVGHEVDVGARLLPGRNELRLRFAALDALLAPSRARPRWRTPMVEHQQLRWWRTTLLGRTPGWSPPAAAVGPWRGIWLERHRGIELVAPRLRATLDAAGDGQLSFDGRLVALDGAPPASATLRLDRGGEQHTLALGHGGADRWHGRFVIPTPQRWWPHTHGEPALYEATLLLQPAGAAVPLSLPLGAVGFRRIELDRRDGGFALRVNGVPVFCRGACWMPLDAVRLGADAAAYRDAIAQVRDAGMNMLRISGATVYEHEAFHNECDRQGVLVWQDFMFANMDYPAEDAAFAASAEAEVRQQLARWAQRPSLAVLCGNSEVEQQAAMWGAPRAQWQSALFHERFAALAAEACPDVPYWPSSAHGGAFPHQVDSGTTSYYGVGAYLGAPSEARRAALKFATECLGFANLPEPATIARMPGGAGLRVHHPGWKARTPRDLGAGWDFEDVRDHYLRLLFGLDPVALRSQDHERYLALGRAVTGEVMAAALAEWRRAASGCGGALVWTLRDLWAGAGWGLLDDAGLPKPCWWAVRRALQPLALAVRNEGHSGLVVDAFNDGAAPLAGRLEVIAYNDDDQPVARGETALPLPARGEQAVAVAALLDGFLDLSAAFRFGPPPAARVWAGWLDADGALRAQAWHFPAGLPSAQGADSGLQATLEREAGGRLAVTLRAGGFAQGVTLELAGHRPDDNHFHLRPGETRRLVLRPDGRPAARLPLLRVASLNARRVLALEVPR